MSSNLAWFLSRILLNCIFFFGGGLHSLDIFLHPQCQQIKFLGWDYLPFDVIFAWCVDWHQEVKGYKIPMHRPLKCNSRIAPKK